MRQNSPVALIPFQPAVSDDFSCSFSVVHENGLLRLDYVIAGPLAAISIPREHENPGFMPNLWLHTCFECFMRREGMEPYMEWNFSLDCNWWMCSFAGYRNSALPQPETAAPHDVEIILRENGIFLKAAVACPDIQGLRIGPAVIIEHAGGNKSYWALWHPADKPDFHLPQTCAPLLS